MAEPIESPEHRDHEVGRFALILAAVATLLAALPLLFGLLAQSDGLLYLQQQTALDDQMVYLSWMRQATEGRFLFENRFAIEDQPGLTFHLYFLILGWISAALGGLWTMSLARLGFAFLFVVLLGRFLRQLDLSVLQSKLALGFAVFGGGLGFAVWESFGRLVQNGSFIGALTRGRLPIDVWQPEAFVFPSMLTSGLFMASLCLMLVIFISVLRAKESWKSVPQGALAFAALMNIHSYDALLILIVLLLSLVAWFKSGEATKDWAIRVGVMGAGALPPAAWFVYVLQSDKVFQARAATLTYSEPFVQVLVGILPLAVLALLVLPPSNPELRPSRLAIGGGLMLLALGSFAHQPDSYFVPALGFVLLVGAAAGLVWMLPKSPPGDGLLWGWALAVVTAPYFPALFQRKLSMGLAIPWAILAAVAVGPFLKQREHSKRLVTGAAMLVIASASSIFWLQRELLFARLNFGSTTLHSVFLTVDAQKILSKLAKQPGRKITLAMPGVPGRGPQGQVQAPILPDMNTYLVGLAGGTAFAGHWSETPDYNQRRAKASAFFVASTSDETRREILSESRASFLLAPNPAAFGNDLIDPRPYGTTLLETPAWILVRVSE